MKLPFQRKVLSEKQLSKIKTSFLVLCGVISVQAMVVAGTYYYEGEEYEKRQVKQYPRG